MTHVYTLANIHEVQDIISDLAKSVYGTRAACPTTPEAQVSFMNSYDSLIEDALEDERRERDNRLAYLNQKHGQVFDTLAIAERFNQQAAHERYMAEIELERQLAYERAEFTRRYSPRPIIEAWEHGSL